MRSLRSISWHRRGGSLHLRRQRLRASALSPSTRARSELDGLLEIEPVLLHARAAMELPARSLEGARIGAVDLLFADSIGLLVGHFLLGGRIGCAEDDEHSGERQHDHFARLPDSEHDVLHRLNSDFQVNLLVILEPAVAPLFRRFYCMQL